MNLYRMLNRHEEQGRPICVGLIGAGKFGTILLHKVHAPKETSSSLPFYVSPVFPSSQPLLRLFPFVLADTGLAEDTA
jgi:hypothetical protein